MLGDFASTETFKVFAKARVSRSERLIRKLIDNAVSEDNMSPLSSKKTSPSLEKSVLSRSKNIKKCKKKKETPLPPSHCSP